ncbi:MAG: hypothetical protein AB7K52_03210 [Phycisphaerales bacterium]
MKNRPSGDNVRALLASLVACGLALMTGCESDGEGAVVADQPQPFIGPQPGPQPAPPGTPSTAFSPQEAVALLVAIQKGEKSVDTLTDRERLILAALAQQQQERRERRGG